MFQSVLDKLASKDNPTGEEEKYNVLAGNPGIGLTAALAVCMWMAPGKRTHLGKLRAALHECAAKITQGMGVASH